MDLGERKRELDLLLAGWITPVFRREDPATGKVLNGLSQEDFDRVCQGYACPECLAIFTTYLATCPVCRWERNVQNDVEAAPEYWKQHLADRESGYAPPIRRGGLDMDRVIEEIMRDGSVEHIPMSKLKNTRKKG